MAVMDLIPVALPVMARSPRLHSCCTVRLYCSPNTGKQIICEREDVREQDQVRCRQPRLRVVHSPRQTPGQEQSIEEILLKEKKIIRWILGSNYDKHETFFYGIKVSY